MNMRSTRLLPALQKLPGGEPGQQKALREIITDLVNTDRAMSTAEYASALSAGMWFIFDDRSFMGINIPFTGINIDDRLFEAYEAQYRSLAADHSLHEQWQDMVERGPDSMEGFISGLKGKVAEFETNGWLESKGWATMTLAPDPDHPFWDNIGINPDGKVGVVQTKTGESSSASDVQDCMAEEHHNLYEQVYGDVQKWVADPEILEKHPELATIAERLADGPDSFVSDRYFSIGSELYGKAVPSGIDEAGRMMADIGPDYELVDGITDGLNTLSSNMGLDIPDGVADLVPYAGAIFAASRLLMSALKTEKEFKAADRTTKNKIQVVQTLTLMSRMGITTVCAVGGGAAGGAGGSIFPAVGNLTVGAIGAIGGCWDRHVPEQPASTPHAEPCAGHYRADQRRPVLLQEQTTHRYSGRELPKDHQGACSGPRMIVRPICTLPQYP